MLDKRSKIILNTLIENGFTYPQSKFVSVEDTLIPLLPCSEKYNWRGDTVSVCVTYLSENGYVSGTPFFHGYYPVPDYRELHVTYKGWHYKNFKWLQLKSDLFRSVALPIVVSLITAAVSTIIGYIWGQGLIIKTKDTNLAPIMNPIVAPMTQDSVVNKSE